MTNNNSQNINSALLKKINKEHQLFLENLDVLRKEQRKLLKKYQQKLEDLKINELRKKLK